MRKGLKIALLSGLGIVLILIGLGIWIGFYQKDLNAQRAKDRVAATQLQNLAIGYDSLSTGFYPNIPFELVTYEYNSHFYEALTRFDSDYHLEPQLATGWENPSDNVWRFRLKENVKFHDGSLMTSKDVKASLDMAMANENTSVMLPGLASVSIVDENTVDLVTSSPSPLLANALTTVFILPEKLIASADYANPIGTGPFEYVSSDSSSVTLKRFDDYHGTQAKAASVILRSYEDATAQLEALRNKEVDIIQNIDNPDGIGKDKDGQSLLTASSSGIGVNFLSLDTISDSSPNISGVTTNPFKDIRVREALQYALDIDQLIEDANIKNAAVGTQTVAPTIFGFDPTIKGTVQDIDKAKELMTAAGYQNGFTITLDISREVFQPLANALKAQLSVIGINLNISLNPPGTSTFVERIASGDSSMFFLEYDCGTGDALEAYQMLFGEQAFYGKAYKDAAMTDLMTKAEGTFDLEKRKVTLQELAQLADKAKAMIPLYVVKQIFAYREGVNPSIRFDGYLTANSISGAVPASLQADYTYLDTLKKILGFKA
jgi:peptide/nickel transport system substrate-binding protein